MFLHRENDPAGPLLISQGSHAWLAWQLAEHWGNRRFARPAPRSEVLAAVFLHDAGWTHFDSDPGIDEEGRPITFDRMPVVEHLEIWRRSVAGAASYSRYAGLLVAAHFGGLVERKTAVLLERGDTTGARSAQAFRAEMERLQAASREALLVDPRYQPYLASGEVQKIGFEALDGTAWRVRPWPLEGDRLRLHCEGRRLAKTTFSSSEELQEALARAPIERTTFTLSRPSAG